MRPNILHICRYVHVQRANYCCLKWRSQYLIWPEQRLHFEAGHKLVFSISECWHLATSLSWHRDHDWMDNVLLANVTGLQAPHLKACACEYDHDKVGWLSPITGITLTPLCRERWYVSLPSLTSNFETPILNTDENIQSPETREQVTSWIKELFALYSAQHSRLGFGITELS